MSSDCNLSVYLWTEGISYAQYLINWRPTRANSRLTSEAKYSGMTPDISNLRIFGCIAYVHVPKETRRKLDSKTLKCLFLGFDSETKAFCLFDPTRQKMIVSCDVVFDESRVEFQHLVFRESLGDFQTQINIPTTPELHTLDLTDTEVHDIPPSATDPNPHSEPDDLPKYIQSTNPETPPRISQAPQPMDSQVDFLV